MNHLLAFTLFFDPLPIWVRNWIWPLLLLPLCAGVAVVYKAIRCKDLSRLPKEAAELCLTIVAGMVAAAGAIAGLAWYMK
jgi:hypothetical protein